MISRKKKSKKEWDKRGVGYTVPVGNTVLVVATIQQYVDHVTLDTRATTTT